MLEDTSKKTVTVVDYGLGNIRSLAQALLAIGCDVDVSSQPQNITRCERLILPGVGSFAVAMRALAATGIDEAILQVARSGVPVLGICLGMQLLYGSSSEFENSPGLKLLDGDVRPFAPRVSLKAGRRSTNTGWRELSYLHSGEGHPLFRGIATGTPFYFVHSYSAHDTEALSDLAVVNYQGAQILAASAKGNVLGTQFHPEKSGTSGLRLLENFVTLSA